MHNLYCPTVYKYYRQKLISVAGLNYQVMIVNVKLGLS